jgi:hypothetical protein
MQRPDRINFPQVASEELWEQVSNDTLSPVDSLSEGFGHAAKHASFSPVINTPLLVSPQMVGHISSPEFPQYFRYRECNDLVTPARTPSDILRRGPLYDSTMSEAETEPTSAHAFANTREEFLKRQIDHHRERRLSISNFVGRFMEKMQDLCDWHKDQECKYQEELTIRAIPKPLDNFPSTTVDYTFSSFCVYN